MPVEKYKSDKDEYSRYRTWALYERYLTSLGKRKNNPYAVTGPRFREIIEKFHENIRDEVIYKNYIFTLPYHLGRIYIYKYKQRLYYDDQGKIDPVRSRLYWNWQKFLSLSQEERKDPEKRKQCYDYNRHSKGYRFRITWVRRKNRMFLVKNISLYQFIPYRYFKTQAKDAFKNLYPKGKVDYFDKTRKYKS